MPSFLSHKTLQGPFGQYCAQKEVVRLAKPGTRCRQVPWVHQGKVRTALCHVGVLLQAPNPVNREQCTQACSVDINT